MHKPIKINAKEITLLKPYTAASYDTKTVLTDSCWEYVELWLRRNSNPRSKDALFYWQQAKHFYNASLVLPENARPLTAYYCILNATKSLLCLQKVNVLNIKHGVSNDERKQVKPTYYLSNATVFFETKGVLSELARYLKEPIGHREDYTVQDLLYNIPCIHRCFCLTYKSLSELFIPVNDIKYVYDDKMKKAWIQFKLDKNYSNSNTTMHLPIGYKKQDNYDGDNSYSIRKNSKMISWDIHKTKKERLKLISDYHGQIRKDFYYISGNTKLWYIKKYLPNNSHIINHSSMVLIFAVMHWLSEQVRYNPKRFEAYTSSKQNWLLHEFIEKALSQFIDEISCEITKEEIMSTGYRSTK